MFLSSSGRIVHGSFFILVAGSKTLVTVGQVCLTVEATVLALNCLAQYHQEKIEYSNTVHAVNVSAQIVAAMFSVAIVMLSRYPKIWKNLKISKLKDKREKLNEALEDSSRTSKATLILVGLFGVLSCIARGISAYLMVEVILGDRAQANVTIVMAVAWVAAVSVTISSMCFNLSNMLTGAAQYLQKPTLSFRPSISLSTLGAVSEAVAKRFFVLHFLQRRHASWGAQIVGQSVFSVAELIQGLFTMTASFEEENWKTNLQQRLQSSRFFTILMVSDLITAWLGYSTIVWYQISSDVFLSGKNQVDDPISACIAQPSQKDFHTRWALMGVSLLIGVPVTVSYCHYVLKYAKKGYDETVQFMGSRCCCGFFASQAGTKEENINLVSTNNFSIV